MNNELEFFNNYYSNYDDSNVKINGKYKHTFRVLSYAEEIARSLDLDEKEITRAKVCALFHDIGRFEQLKQFNTYNDKLSFDHGDKGYEILKENNYDDEIVLIAVKYHNKKDVPEFDELTNIHSKIVRDADKIDILVVHGTKLEKKDYEITDEVVSYFINHSLLDINYDNSEVLYILRQLAFIFDINYKKSIEIILNKDLINQKINLLKSKCDNEKIEIIEKEIKEYIKERFDIKC